MATPSITTYNESALHADLKAWLAQPGDEIEKMVDGAVVDIVRGPLLIEVQTGNFGKIRPKLQRLVRTHPVLLVYPVASEKWIVRLDGDKLIGRRKSPVRGTWWHAFNELVYIPRLMTKPGFALEVVLIQETEERRYVGRKAWRKRGWGTDQRRLVSVLESRVFTSPADLLALLPAALPEPFTTADLAEAIGERRRLAQKIAYALRRMDALVVTGKSGRANLYRINNPQA
jgi:hypothetical protein